MEKSMKGLKLVGCFLALLVGLFSISITITTLASIPVYYLYSQLFNLGESVGLTHQQLQVSYQSIVQYLLHPFTEILTIPYFSSSAQGLQHFQDVKLLIQLNALISVLACVGLPWIVRQLKVAREYLFVQAGFYFLYSVPLLFLFMIFVNFERIFILFHEIVFTNDYWLFDPIYDPIITVLPESFFMLLFIIVILLYELFVFIISQWYQRR
ncbi:TIGR01906 family membrane protein [Aerococcaceae bacterium DSM 111020]|nr:TIGR01906 family membrane protein [Aerococcaceae bacterium DSM 111020]